MAPRLLLLLAILGLAGDVAAQDRFALVIGNGKYKGAAALNNPPNDAASIAAALEKLDFKVTRKTDADLSSTEEAVLSFRKSLTKKSIALFFYAGHGLQVKGENFLLPVDANVQEESQVKRKCYPVEELLTELDTSGAALKVVILDSCRDNPLTRGWTRSVGTGLASIAQIPDGTIISFSTAPGKTALDGRGANSPFTKHLVACFDRRPAEGLELIGALRATGQAVSDESGQRPWINFDTSVRDFYLWRDVNASPIASLPKPPAEEKVPSPRNLKRINHPADSKFESVENTIGMKFVAIPAGEFLMGSSDDDTDAFANEFPQHRVKITHSFYLGMHEVTLGQFLKFYHAAKYKTDAEKDGKGGGGVDAASGTFKQGPEFVAWTTGFPQTMQHPAVNISWNDAKAFCEWQSENENQTYRLPTEAEWEYSCRAGTKTRFSFGVSPELLARVGNVADGTLKEKFSSLTTITSKDGFMFSAPVGSFRPNPFGLFDMHGNVCEWCEDGYKQDGYEARSGIVSNPVDTSGELKHRAIRSSGWAHEPRFSRSADRGGNPPDFRGVCMGFRVVLERTP